MKRRLLLRITNFGDSSSRWGFAVCLTFNVYLPPARKDPPRKEKLEAVFLCSFRKSLYHNN
jgi:hypothetical protein